MTGDDDMLMTSGDKLMTDDDDMLMTDDDDNMTNILCRTTIVQLYASVR